MLAVSIGLTAPFALHARRPLAAGTAAANDDTGGRLTRRIDVLTAMLTSVGAAQSADAQIGALIKADARSELFRLEGLLRLYRRQFPKLTSHLKIVKEVEDGVGAYAFAVDSLSFAKDRFKQENAGKPADAARAADQAKVLDGLARKETTARGVLATLLVTTKLPTDLPALRTLVVSSFAKWDNGKDLAYVKDELQRTLRTVRDGRFDFKKMEDGIHEYRRQLRWFVMMLDGLDGAILLRDDPPMACPIPALASLAESPAARSKYSNPSQRYPPAKSCAISRCLVWEVVKAVRDLGRIKDEFQGKAAIDSALDDNDVVTTNAATPEEVASAKAIRDELNKSRALETLVSQIGACKG